MNEKTIRNWIELAQYDLETAEAMVEKGRYLYVAFTCQQAIEKTLKALYVKEKGETPPYSHNLMKLIDMVSLKNALSPEQIDFIIVLNTYYIQTRYSEEIKLLSKTQCIR
jgi:HEPN domain-containing protein